MAEKQYQTRRQVEFISADLKDKTGNAVARDRVN